VRNINTDKLNGLVGKNAWRPRRRLQRAYRTDRLQVGPFSKLCITARQQPITCSRTGLAKRYVAEWALAQASNGYIYQ